MAAATAIARTIADSCAPLGVQTTLASAHRARLSGEQAAIERLRPDIAHLMTTDDGIEGMRSFAARRAAVFTGH